MNPLMILVKIIRGFIRLGPLFEQSDEQFRSKLDDLGLKDIKIRRSICTYNDAVKL